MDTNVLYAISANGYNTRPGYVETITEAPFKLSVKVFWTWPGQEDDYLNPTPPVLTEFAKFDVKQVTTGEIVEPWADYCARVKAERRVALDKKLAEEAAAEAKRLADIARVEAIAPLLAGSQWLKTMEWVAKSGDRMSQREFSTNDVVNIIDTVLRVNHILGFYDELRGVSQ